MDDVLPIIEGGPWNRFVKMHPIYPWLPAGSVVIVEQYEMTDVIYDPRLYESLEANQTRNTAEFKRNDKILKIT